MISVFTVTLYAHSYTSNLGQFNTVEQCVKEIRDSMLSNFPLLNPDKTEVLVLGPHVAKSKLLDHTLTLDSATVKDLGVILDSNLSFEAHVDNITRIAFYNLRNIAKIRNILSLNDAEK